MVHYVRMKILGMRIYGLTISGALMIAALVVHGQDAGTETGVVGAQGFPGGRAGSTASTTDSGYLAAAADASGHACAKETRAQAQKTEIQKLTAALSCQSHPDAVFLNTSCLRRVRLVVRTQPSQGWCTGSTPVRAANPDD